MKKLQGPKSPGWIQNIQLMTDFLGYLENLGKRYGDIYLMQLLGNPTVLVSDPEAIRKIFTDITEIKSPGELNQVSIPLTGKKGILTLDGLHHKHMRKLLMPAFHGAHIKNYGQSICNLAIKVMNQQEIGKPFSACASIEDITLQIILKVILGLEEGERYQKFRQLIPSLLNFSLSPLMALFFSLPILQKDLGSWSPWGKFLNLRRQLDELLYAEVILCRKQANPSRTDIVSLLVSACDEAGEPLSNQDVRDMLLSLLYAGQDASATAIAWAVYWVHKYPTVHKKLLAEINSLGESPDPVSISRLPYLSAVCNEALRLYPTQVLTFGRKAQSHIELMGYEFSPGTIFMANIYQTHQREDLYPQASQFKPERFLERQFSPYEFSTFWWCDRGCLGVALVLFEMKLILATIISNYELALVDKKPEKPKCKGILFPPANGLKMAIVARCQNQAQQVTANSI
ncbi:MAG: cytochrome P450 [Calothrix sp. SM1_7_51]|nr:cytochrome P450 [Calothrix sp. SM1_7_51]